MRVWHAMFCTARSWLFRFGRARLRPSLCHPMTTSINLSALTNVPTGSHSQVQYEFEHELAGPAPAFVDARRCDQRMSLLVDLVAFTFRFVPPKEDGVNNQSGDDPDQSDPGTVAILLKHKRTNKDQHLSDHKEYWDDGI